MHAAITDGVDWATFYFATTWLIKHETVCVAKRFWHDQHAEASVGLGAICVCSGEEHQHVGASSKCAPCFDTVDDVSDFTFFVRCFDGRDFDICDVAAIVGLGHCNSGHYFCGCEFWKPILFLCFSAAVDKCASEDLGACDE